MTASDTIAPVGTPIRPGQAATAERPALALEVRDLLQAFARTASSALNLSAGLAVLCHGAARVFATARASAWLHDRRSRELVLAAASDAAGSAEGTRVRTDSDVLPAIALRRETTVRQETVDRGTTPGRCGGAVLAVPLRGRRRALGVLVLEGLALEAGSPVVAEAEELGRQLSVAIENLLLLEDVLRSRRELAHTFDSLEDLVAICDPHLRVVYCNRTLGDRLAIPRDRIIDHALSGLVGSTGREWLETVNPADPGQTAGAFARELDDERLGGRFTMTVTPLVAADGTVTGAVFVARDITPQVRLEAERAALRERLTQSEKLAALGQFVAGIAHELNNPLQAVLGNLELLRRQGRVPASIRTEMAVVAREADRAARIVDNLLIFAGGRRAARRPLNVNTVVARTLAMRAAAWRGAGIELLRSLDEPLPSVSGNSLLLQQALFNVLLNAEQALAASGGGRIEVATSHVPSEQTVRIEIRDTGPGIDADGLTRIFEPFYTTKEVGKGTGLGLAITYGIVREHGGSVSAANHPKGGALFTIDLPAADGIRRPAGGARAGRGSAPGGAGRGKRPRVPRSRKTGA